MPTLPQDQGSKVGQELPVCGHVVQPEAHSQGILAVGSGPSPIPYTPAPSPGVGWQPRWSAAFPRGQRGWALAAPVGARATARERRHHGRPGALGWRPADPVPPTGRGSARGLGADPQPCQGWATGEWRAGGPPSSAASLLRGWRGQPVPGGEVPTAVGRGHGAPSCCQVVGRLGGTLGPLDDSWALLPPQQLVVLEEALVTGHPVGAVGEGQETWGGEGRARSDGAGSSTHQDRGWG